MPGPRTGQTGMTRVKRHYAPTGMGTWGLPGSRCPRPFASLCWFLTAGSEGQVSGTDMSDLVSARPRNDASSLPNPPAQPAHIPGGAPSDALASMMSTGAENPAPSSK